MDIVYMDIVFFGTCDPQLHSLSQKFCLQKDLVDLKVL